MNDDRNRAVFFDLQKLTSAFLTRPTGPVARLVGDFQVIAVLAAFGEEFFHELLVLGHQFPELQADCLAADSQDDAIVCGIAFSILRKSLPGAGGRVSVDVMPDAGLSRRGCCQNGGD